MKTNCELCNKREPRLRRIMIRKTVFRVCKSCRLKAGAIHNNKNKLSSAGDSFEHIGGNVNGK